MRRLLTPAPRPSHGQPRPHRWVAAARVELGRGHRDERAERARAGRYVVPAATWLERLEIYCGQCRAPSHRWLTATDCPGLGSERVYYDRAAMAN